MAATQEQERSTVAMDMPTPIEQPAASGFDYSALPAEIVPRQRERADRIRGMYRQTVETAGEIGHELLAAQGEMEHGQFLSWVTGAVGLSKSTAYRCMDMARSFGPKLPTVGSLPLAVVHKLAEKSTPEPVRAAVLHRIEAGETMVAATILREVREAREAEQARVKAEREAARRAGLSDEQREAEDALRAKDERGKAARTRRDEKFRAERRAEVRQQRDRAQASAVALVKRFGVDDAAAFLSLLGGAVNSVAQATLDLIDVERASSVDPVQIRANLIVEAGRLYDDFVGPEAMAEAELLAEEIKRDGLREPLVVRRTDRAGKYLGEYDLVDGAKRFLAVVRVMKQSKISVRIVPDREG
ncbi:DUF3102 domain-containing protein [Methylobacterium sp. E-041]|uniref:DUF3102 domain-containing protein n=1 Tax=Methylobacterium sp. E-041 TaxID=2836573 RepID=UPI001FB99FD8|nr:DUF3102 domain-containing protein [Methylobacterium sp. E-041]MCJ2108550.1 DUF3102 domain-containing protein [Methylobacterium sp. E-041]